MKVKNIMFFGFAAAILSATGAKAAYTPTDADRKIVTSKAYVESRLDTKYDASNPNNYQTNVLEGVKVGDNDLTIDANKKVTLGNAAVANVSDVTIDSAADLATLQSSNDLLTADQYYQGAVLLDSAKQGKDTNAQEGDIATFNSTGSSHSSGKTFTTSITSSSTDAEVPTAAAVKNAIDNKQDRESASAQGSIAVFDINGNSVTSSKKFDDSTGGLIQNDTAYVPTSKTVYDALATKQNLLGGGTDAGKVVTATNNAGVVSYTTVSSTIDTTVNTDNNNIPTVGAVEGAITTATANVANKQDKIGTNHENEIATFDSTGQTQDSGKSFETSSLTNDASKVPTSNVVYGELGNKQNTNTAVKYNGSTAVGSATTPVYVDASGNVTASTYTIETSVPSTAVFTDHEYNGDNTTIVLNADGRTFNAVTGAVASSNSGLVTGATVASAIEAATGGNSIPTQPSACSQTGNTCALVSDEGTLKWVVMADDQHGGSVPSGN